MVLCVWDSVKICEADFGVIDFLSPMKKWVVLLYLDLSNQALENTSSQTVPSNGQLKWEWILHISLLCHSLYDLRVLCIPILFLSTGHSTEVVILYPQHVRSAHGRLKVHTGVRWSFQPCKEAMWVLFNNLLSKRPSYSDPMAVTHCTLRWCYIHTSFIILVQICNLFCCNHRKSPP